MPITGAWRFVVITDACCKEAAKQAEQSGVEVLRVGTAADNLVITRFTARRSKADPVKCEVLVEVRNQGDQPAQGRVTLVIEEKSGKLPSPSGRGAGGEGGLQSGKLPSPFGRGAGGEGGLQSAQFSIIKDGRWQHLFELDLPAAARLTARIEPGDVYLFDDTAVLDVPAAPAAHRVKLAG